MLPVSAAAVAADAVATFAAAAAVVAAGSSSLTFAAVHRQPTLKSSRTRRFRSL